MLIKNTMLSTHVQLCLHVLCKCAYYMYKQLLCVTYMSYVLLITIMYYVLLITIMSNLHVPCYFRTFEPKPELRARAEDLLKHPFIVE